VTRKHSRWRDRGRAYRVLIDGLEVGKLRHGRSEEFDVRPGKHGIRLKIDWMGSDELPVNVHAGQTAAFVCEPNGRAIDASRDLFRRTKPWIALGRDATPAQ
jgi:hypothetical protein